MSEGVASSETPPRPGEAAREAESTSSERSHLSGASALVVGASRGIGEAVARSLSAAGARVHVAARSMDVLRGIAEDIGGEAL